MSATGRLLCSIFIFFLTKDPQDVDGAVKCPTNSMGSQAAAATEEDTIFDFGRPVIFASSLSQNVHPYSLIDQHRRTAVLQEYLMLGYLDTGYGHVKETLQILIVDEVKSVNADAADFPNLIHQNLEKVLYWRFFNSTGVYPSLTIQNSTLQKRIEFHTTVVDDNDSGEHPKIAFYAELFQTKYLVEPQVPYDVIFEIPGQSRVLRREMTMIQYQSFSLWRWRLSEVTVNWHQILEESDENVPPANSTTPVPEHKEHQKVYPEFNRIDNPCTKDLFLVTTNRTRKAGGAPVVYLASPLIQSHLGESWFYDMSSPGQPWGNETVTQIVLTNDHLIALTNGALYISESLNGSRLEEIDLTMRVKHTEKPLLKFRRTNPCEDYKGTFQCFVEPQNDTIADHLNLEYRIFHNPTCYLNQVPFYEDHVVLVVRNSTNQPNQFTILYSVTPYKDWFLLFSNVVYYKRYVRVGKVQREKRFYIREILGVIFNHHVGHYDITVALSERLDTNLNDDDWKNVRFFVTVPAGFSDGYGSIVAKHPSWNPGGLAIRELDMLKDDDLNRLPDFEFPKDFKLESVLMNSETLDIYFLGNQFWIAETAGPFAYLALGGIPKLRYTSCDGRENVTKEFSIVRDCSFNHADKLYLCMNEDRHIIIAGKIGSSYSPILIRADDIGELAQAQITNAWSPKFTCELLQKRTLFVPGYSGRLLMWYLYDPKTAADDFNADIDTDPYCLKTLRPELCDTLKEFKARGCVGDPKGVPEFRMISIDPVALTSMRQSPDGPLVPFLVDATTAILFEGEVHLGVDLTVPDRYDYHTYFSEVNIGQVILCENYDLLKLEANDVRARRNCELFIRHIKTTDGYLDGFRRSVYATIIQSIPMLPVPADVVVLVQEQSNHVLVKIDDHMNNPKWTFTARNIGQTLYLPGNFSVLLAGFPRWPDQSLMEGYATMFSHYERRLVYHAFFSFLMDMSTPHFRETYNQTLTNKREAKRLAQINARLRAYFETEVETRNRIQNKWDKSPFSYKRNGVAEKVFDHPVPPFVPREEVETELLKVKDSERHTFFPAGVEPQSWAEEPPPPADKLALGLIPYEDRSIWHLSEGDCNYVLTLEDNPVLKGSGGRISLDLHDSISLFVLLRSASPLGKVMMHRPLLVVTNSNPNILHVGKNEKLNEDPQSLRITLSATGYGRGTAVVTIRIIVRALNCDRTSITFTVSLHREAGRRLHAHYPIPTCKPLAELGMYPRPWFIENKGCINRDELLDKKQEEIHRFRHDRRHTAYITLPTNYRPPSFDGTDIPLSKNIYNADPSRQPFRSWYRVSRQSFQYSKCHGKATREECGCTDNERLLEDEYVTECKEKVFYTHRTGSGKPIYMSMDYDRIMRDGDQYQDLFSKKTNWSIKIEEVNGRAEWYITSVPTVYLTEVNTKEGLNDGIKHFDMKGFYVTLLGTGLFHFKATLASFESFDEVTGYFMMYASTDEINHIHLFLIILGTILFCMTMVFLGFLAVRKRLSAMLPVQPLHQRKFKLL